MNKRILSNLGIDEKTERVYRSLLKVGDATASVVAKSSGLKRTSIYHILESLVEMGVVSTYISRGTKRYSAENPLAMQHFFEQKSIIAKRLVPLLMKEVNASAGKIKVKMFDGLDGIKVATEKSLDSKDKTIYTIGSSKKLVEFTGGTYGLGSRRRKLGLHMKSLRFASDKTDIRPERMQQVKFMSENYDFPGFVMFFDSTVIIIFYSSGGHAILVESKDFYKIIKTLFDVFWEMLG